MPETRWRRLLAGKPVPVAHTPAFGCSTKWKSKIDSQLDELKKIEAEPVKVDMATADDLKKLRTNPTGKVLAGQLLGHLVRTLPERISRSGDHLPDVPPPRFRPGDRLHEPAR